eukprot:gnl/Chilomastix_cuspidata/9499.p1 GENE.gnl/Chilomastix_cuspidata/9499~~gnl/Chilomastix_cuspidata/9499.p1  ORF type:complete len:684 (-),score=-39.81 gnl/Chilomastix_cuspidata/9499:211-2262(-)
MCLFSRKFFMFFYILILTPLCINLSFSSGFCESYSYSSEKKDAKEDDEDTAVFKQTMTVKDKKGTGIRTIPTDVLKRTQALDMSDVFKTEPSVSVGGGSRNAQRIYIRGIEGSNLSITVDGAKQNTNMHQHRGGIGNIEPYLLKKIDVHPGPGADQGPGALGGSIKFETVDAQDLLDYGKSFGAMFRAGYASADESWNGGSTLYGQAENIGFFVHASGTDTEDYRVGGGGEVPNSAADDRDYMAKFSMLDMSGHDLRMSAEHNTSEGLYLWGRTGSDFGYAPEDSVPVSQEIKRDTYTFDYRFDPSTRLVNLKFNTYLADNSLKNKDSGSEYKSRQTGGDLRNTFGFETGMIFHNLTIGADYLREKGEGERSFGAKEGQNIENVSDNIGFFVQERIGIGPLGVSMGVRYDDFESEYGPNTFDDDEFSPNIGLDYELLRGVTVFANYGEAVRGSGIIPVGWMVNLDETTNFNDGKPFKPETSEQKEGGIRYSANGLINQHDHFDIELSVFRTELENTIERVGGGGGAVSKIWNNPEAVISKGFEVRAEWGFGKYETTMGYTHTDTEDEDGNPISIIRRKAAPAGDRFVWDNRFQMTESVIFGYTMTAVKRLDDVAEGDPERAGYMIHDIQAQWEDALIDGFSLSLALGNIFDQKYIDQTSIGSDSAGIVHEPGRDVRIMASYRF